MSKKAENMLADGDIALGADGMPTAIGLSLLAANIAAEAHQLATEGAAAITAAMDCWNMKDDPDGYRVSLMTDTEIEMAFVEDLLLATQWRSEGKETGGNLDHHLRFLTGAVKSRVEQIVTTSPTIRAMTNIDDKGTILIFEDSLDEAMEFAGFWIGDAEFEAGTDTVYFGP